MMGQALQHRHQRCDPDTAGDEHDRPVANLCESSVNSPQGGPMSSTSPSMTLTVKIIRDQAGRSSGRRPRFSLDADTKMIEAGTIRQTVIARRRR